MIKKIFSRNYTRIEEAERLEIIERSSRQVSRGVFYSTIIIITSFLPVFMLTGQEGKLFHPLAYTKTFIMLVDALLVVTLAPVIISFFMKGKFNGERKNPINNFLERIYEPIIRVCMKCRNGALRFCFPASALRAGPDHLDDVPRNVTARPSQVAVPRLRARWRSGQPISRALHRHS